MKTTQQKISMNVLFVCFLIYTQLLFVQTIQISKFSNNSSSKKHLSLIQDNTVLVSSQNGSTQTSETNPASSNSVSTITQANTNTQPSQNTKTTNQTTNSNTSLENQSTEENLETELTSLLANIESVLKIVKDDDSQNKQIMTYLNQIKQLSENINTISSILVLVMK